MAKRTLRTTTRTTGKSATGPARPRSGRTAPKSAGAAPESAAPRPTRPDRPVVSTADLARHLDLSEWTVSRAINGHPEVKAATRKRVLEAMQELGFQPNPHARGLNGKATGLVGICFGDPRNSLVIDKIATLEEFLRRHQLRGILAITPHDLESELRIISDFKHMRVDGMVLIQSYLSGAVLDKALRGCKGVLVDPAEPAAGFPYIHLNRIRAMRFLVDHLYSLGHREFGTVGFSDNNRWRWDGILAALMCNSLDPGAPRVLRSYELPAVGAEAYAEGVELAQLVLADPKPPSALIVVNDRVAAGLMQGLRDAGKHVPHDFSVTGFDNLPVGRTLRPTLTTIDQQPTIAMERAGEMLLQQLGLSTDPHPHDNLLLDPVFHMRESTGYSPRRRADMASHA
ncbi:hypothetical protein DB346_02290 [Verrucomicrobia bacterium LW23]|nr:hypothetical protein DB346_02290 [Verrucomicrobia bacterium LW23]